VTTITIDRALLEQALRYLNDRRLVENECDRRKRNETNQDHADRISSVMQRNEDLRELIEEVEAALAAPATAPVSSLPEGWRVDAKDDLFKTIRVVAPNGYSAITTSTSRNPENVLRMLVQDLLSAAPKAPATAPEQPNPYDACESFKAYQLACRREAALQNEVDRLRAELAKPPTPAWHDAPEVAERKPMSDAQKNALWLVANSERNRLSRQSFLDGVESAEAFHSTKEGGAA